MKKARPIDFVEYAALMPVVGLLRLLPAGAALRISAALGRFAFDVLGFRREVALSNIRERLPAPEPAAGGPQPADVARACYSQFAMSMAEMARLPLVDAGYLRNWIEVEGAGHLDRALEARRGGVLVTGHYGSWELMGRALVMMGYPLTFAVGVQRNPLVQRLMNDLRRSAGIDLVEASSTLSLARKVKAGKFVAMLSDQDAGRDGVFVDFMGAPASTPQGPARLALLTGSPVISGFITRRGTLRQRITILPPILPRPGARRQDEIRRITQEYTAALEARVRERPDHWLWGHRRWKTRPG